MTAERQVGERLSEQPKHFTMSGSFTTGDIPGHLRDTPLPVAWWEHIESLSRQLAEAKRVVEAAQEYVKARACGRGSRDQAAELQAALAALNPPDPPASHKGAAPVLTAASTGLTGEASGEGNDPEPGAALDPPASPAEGSEAATEVEGDRG